MLYLSGIRLRVKWDELTASQMAKACKSSSTYQGDVRWATNAFATKRSTCNRKRKNLTDCSGLRLSITRTKSPPQFAITNHASQSELLFSSAVAADTSNDRRARSQQTRKETVRAETNVRLVCRQIVIVGEVALQFSKSTPSYVLRDLNRSTPGRRV